MVLTYGPVGAQYQTPKLDSYTKQQIDVAYQRAACVETYRSVRCNWPSNQSDWLPPLVRQLRDKHPGLRISKRGLHRWYMLYQTPSDLVKLIDKRGGNQKGEADPA